jgi:predicted metal-dependent TIM-barrel fold hydrolase
LSPFAQYGKQMLYSGKLFRMLNAKLLLAGILFSLSLPYYCNAQQRVFDVHLHGAKEPRTQLENLTKAGVYKIAISTSWDLQQQYMKRDDLYVLRGLMVPCPNGKVPYSLQSCFKDDNEWPSLDWVEDQIKAGNINFIGEVLSQYHGISSSDSMLLPYYHLAKKYNIPVGIHTGSAGPDHGCPNFQEQLGSPALMATLLKQVPGLRVWIMHAGAPYHQEAIEIMKSFPQVYTDISAINNPNILNQEQFAAIVKLFVDSGLEDRIMFGSDNGDIDTTMKSVSQLAFLTKKQKEKIFHLNAEKFFEAKN